MSSVFKVPKKLSTGALSQHRRQVEPALGGRYVSDIAGPDAVQLFHLKLAVQNIGRHRTVVSGVGGYFKAPFLLGPDLALPHQPGHPVSCALLALCPQFGVNPGAAICAAAF